MDRCLGCMACVTACPSGVQYDKLIEATRAQVERRYDAHAGRPRFPLACSSRSSPTPAGCALRCPSSGSTSGAARRRCCARRWHASVIPARLRGMEAVLPPVHARRDCGARAPPSPRRRAQRGGGSGCWPGCVQRVFFDPVNAATIRVLAAEGCDVVVPEDQGCCGALNFHAGREAGGAGAAPARTDRRLRAARRGYDRRQRGRAAARR